MQGIRYGYCRCGCGHKTEIAPRTRGPLGWTKGEPKPYLTGHKQRRLHAAARVWYQNIHGRWFIYDRNGRRILWYRVVMQDKLGGVELPPGSVVHHINGDPSDDRPENLELIASHGDHMRTHGRELWTKAKLTPEQVRSLRARFAASGLRPYSFAHQVAPALGVNDSAIYQLVKGKTWRGPEYWPIEDADV